MVASMVGVRQSKEQVPRFKISGVGLAGIFVGLCTCLTPCVLLLPVLVVDVAFLYSVFPGQNSSKTTRN